LGRRSITGWPSGSFGNDISQGVVEERIKEHRQSGIRSGVNGTPTFFVNGTRYDGMPDYASLLAALESGLA
jgi:protein-disulfide isomerase